MDVVAGQPVWRGDQDQVKIGRRCMIPQPVQARPAQAGAAIAVITVDMLLRQLPATPGNRLAQPSSCCSMVCAWACQGDITLQDRSPQTKRPVPPAQAQPHPPHTAELAICD